MKKVLLLLLPLFLLGCKEEKVTESSIKKYNYVYIDCSNCIHTDRTCKHIGSNPHNAKIPWINIVSMDSLETYDRGDIYYDYKDVFVCAFCVSDEDHQTIIETANNLH